MAGYDSTRPEYGRALTPSHICYNGVVNNIPKIRKRPIRPTEKQEKTFFHLQRAKSLQEAMLKGGYSKSASLKPKQNFTDREGVKTLAQEYRDHLVNAGVSPELLAEIQAEGLFDQNAAIRLGYVKETKRDFGLGQESINNIQVNNIIAVKRDEYTI